MSIRRTVSVIDLFSGPGGLGEGFRSYSMKDGNFYPFQITMSAEMDAVACKTLCLRSFFWKTYLQGGVPQAYYDYISGKQAQPFDKETSRLWDEAIEETRPVTLGSKEGDHEVDLRLGRLGVSSGDPTVLIGGPPCQAYSLVGRARNKGIQGYVPEEDHRHFLYQDYLRILAKCKPDVFVMENVKGILSSRVAGKKVFHNILRDLAAPEKALRPSSRSSKPGYRLYSLVTGEHFVRGDDPEAFDSRSFVVRAEDHGIPQKRHRVFILGVREDVDAIPERLESGETVTCRQAIGDLPALRSGLSKISDNSEKWSEIVRKEGRALIKGLKKTEISDIVDVIANSLTDMNSGSFSLDRCFTSRSRSELLAKGYGTGIPVEMRDWLLDNRLSAVSNHETRGHISSDLGRYLFSSSFGKIFGESPKARDFPESLAPSHANWHSGKFADRFRVQLAEQPATTVTSHISKDGHYFIHYDPKQCRSLTVREAARIQTFPDNYHFEGNRTQQYGQVGNAVPPLLANQIARIVYKIFH